jgi:predicted ATP-dependent serine protease
MTKLKPEIKKSILRELCSRGIVKLEDLNFPPELFIPLKTGNTVDKLLSYDGGLYKSTNIMFDGDPGTGKTTCTLNILCDIVANNEGAEGLFVSAEMNPVDMKMYAKRYPKFNKVNTLFVGGIPEKELIEMLEKEFNHGYDVIMIDSVVELQLAIRESAYFISDKRTRDLLTSEKGSFGYLLDLLEKQNMAENERGVYTSSLLIQQVNKSGIFVGSNRIKHMTTASFHYLFYDSSQEDRYLVSSKNRRGPVGKPLFYDISGNDLISYNTKKFNEDEKNRAKKVEEKENKNKQILDFDEAFGFNIDKQAFNETVSSEKEKFEELKNK